MIRFRAWIGWILMLAPILGAELPTKGFRAVKGGASPDGGWLIAVLDSSSEEFTDQLPDAHRSAYLIDLHTMKALTTLPDVTTLGGLWGRPETNVDAKWFPNSGKVVVGSRQGRMNYNFKLFSVSKQGELKSMALADPQKIEKAFLAKFEPNSNCGSYVDQITRDGKLVVVYYGYWPKEEAFFDTEEGKRFDHNRLEIVYELKQSQWAVTSAGSPGIHAPKRR